MNSQQLASTADELRCWIIDMLMEAKSGHPGGSLSAIDLLTALWFNEMRGVEAPDRLAADRDRFVLSKGHAVPALYAILAKKGFIGVDELKTLRRTGSRLQGHPDRVRMPIVEASTGSLGQGLSVAQGMALGMKRIVIYRKIILPQAMAIAMPTVGGYFISLLKDCSLVSVIAVEELLRQGGRYAELFEAARAASAAYADEIQRGVFPGPEHSFGASKPAAAPLETKPAGGYGPNE